MKKHLLFIFLIIFSSAKLHAQWTSIGQPGFSIGAANHISLSMDSNDTLYLAYAEGANNNKATVMKFNGTDWVNVGTAGFSAGSASGLSLAIDGNDMPYIAYEDGANSNRVTVMMFNGANWVNVGPAGFATGGTNLERVSLSLDGNNIAYVAFAEANNSNRVNVMKFDGINWVNLGSTLPGFFHRDVSLVIDKNDTLYVAFSDGGNNNKAMVMKFNGSNWISLGSPGFSASQANYISLSLDNNNTPYVVYRDGGSSGKATMMKFDGTDWTYVGLAGFSSGAVMHPSLALDKNDIPYVAYNDGGNASKATVMKFNGIDWVNVGMAGFSTGNAYYFSLRLDTSNNPYVGYSDWGNSKKATVMTYIEPCIPPLINSHPVDSTICEGNNALFSVVATGTALNYQWEENQGSGFVSLSDNSIYTGVSTDTVSFTGVTSAMNGYTYRCIVSGICAPNYTSDIVNLVVNDLPAITSNPTDSMVCPGADVSFSVAASGTNLAYQWEENRGTGFMSLADTPPYSGITTSAINISATTNSMNGYEYRCVVSGSCAPVDISAVATLTVGCTKIDKVGPLAEINIYPNPNKGVFVVEMTEESIATMEIYNALGKIVHTEKMTKISNLIQVKILTDGIYFYRLSSPNKYLQSGRLMIRK